MLGKYSLGGNTLNRHYNQVKQFHKACGIEMPDKPTMLVTGDEKGNNFYADKLEILCERMKHDAPLCNSEVMKRAAYILEETIELLRAKTIEDQADALADIQYFTIGTHTLMGVTPEKIFDIVAEANLGKIMPDGTVLRDENGKIQKPEGWKEKYAPEERIKAEIDRQAWKLDLLADEIGTTNFEIKGSN